jgi:hypothetical protein
MKADVFKEWAIGLKVAAVYEWAICENLPVTGVNKIATKML